MKIGNIKEITKMIEKYDSIIIFHHTRPDGDCLGSQLGLKELIKSNYKGKKVYAIGNAEGRFKFLNLKHDKIPSAKILKKSLGIVVDANYTNRIVHGELLLEDYLAASIRIDHHPNDDDVKYVTRWVDSSYIASAEQVADLAFQNKWKVSKKAATMVYLGINTDSGRFLYDKTSPRTLRLAAFLWEQGVDIDFLHGNMAKRSKRDVDFLGYALSNYKSKGKVNYLYMNKKAQKKLKLSPADSARVNHLANIGDSQIWLFFIDEEEKNKIRVEFRSNGPKVNKIARKFDGGGHDRASGCSLWTPKDIQKVVDECVKACK